MTSSETQALGIVHLVGSGPGDPRLITVRGRELIDRADAIVFDRSVSRALLPPRARELGHPELFDAGRRARGNSSRSSVNDLLVRLAREGKRVVRLYGGDPFVFGRGSDEAQALNDASVPFEVVPGITAGIAAAAHAGIPVTHRGLAHSVTFVSGGEIPGRPATQTNWSALAKAGGTIVIYMPSASIRSTTTALLESGMPEELPVAIVQRGTRAGQRTLTATLGTIADRARDAAIATPSLLVAGWTVILRDELAWFERLPFFGRRILVSRDRASKALADRLRELGARVSHVPVSTNIRLDLTGLRGELAAIGEYSWVIFATADSVAIFWEQLLGSARDARALAGLSICAVSAEAAGALLERGITVDVIPDRFTEEAVLEKLGERDDVAGSRALIIGPEGINPEIASGIESLGAEPTVIPVYRPIPDDREVARLTAALERGRIDAVAFTSPAEVRAFAAIAGAERTRAVRAATISASVTEAIETAGIPLLCEAEEPTMESLIVALERALK